MEEQEVASVQRPSSAANMKSPCTRASMPSMYEFRHHLENGCVGHAHAKRIKTLLDFFGPRHSTRL